MLNWEDIPSLYADSLSTHRARLSQALSQQKLIVYYAVHEFSCFAQNLVSCDDTMTMLSIWHSLPNWELNDAVIQDCLLISDRIEHTKLSQSSHESILPPNNAFADIKRPLFPCVEYRKGALYRNKVACINAVNRFSVIGKRHAIRGEECVIVKERRSS